MCFLKNIFASGRKIWVIPIMIDPIKNEFSRIEVCGSDAQTHQKADSELKFRDRLNITARTDPGDHLHQFSDFLGGKLNIHKEQRIVWKQK